MNIIQCSRCIMDTTDPEISFDKNGYCNHCTNFFMKQKFEMFPYIQDKRKLSILLEKIRYAGKNKKYDCVIGLSGGVDSSYLAYKSKGWGLRPLFIHVDAGWNSKTSEENIRRIVEYCGFDLYIYTVDWKEMRDLQNSYLRAAIANQDVPQDHVFFAVLFKKCAEFGITYWLSGHNIATESILPSAWGYNAMDSSQLLAIHKKYGTVPLKSYLYLTPAEYLMYYRGIQDKYKIECVYPLNFIDYNVINAKMIMQSSFKWTDYGKKHYESCFTKFFQAYYLPTKFGYDKRKAHLSSLIVSGIISRDEALSEMKNKLYTEEELIKDKYFILDKLGLSDKEFDDIMSLPNKHYSDYPNNEAMFKRAEHLHFIEKHAKMISEIR